MLETCIQAFRVFANHNQIQFGITTGNIWQRANRSQVGVEIERLAQTNVYGSETFADGSGDWTFERHLVAQDGIEECLRQCFAELFQRLGTCVVGLPLDVNACSFDDSNYV